MLYGCIPWSPPACHFDMLRRAHHSFLTRCIGWRKNNRADHPISYLDTLIKTGSESIEATLSRRWILLARFMTCMEDTRLPKYVIFIELEEGRGLRGGAGVTVDEVFPGRSQSFRYQRRLVDDCSPGRRGMTQDGGTRGGTFHGEMYRCRESQGWTAACSNVPERDGKDNEKIAQSKWGRRKLVSSRRMPCCLSLVLRLFFCFVFVFFISLKPRPFVQAFFVLRYACTPTATRSYLTNVCVLFFVFLSFFFLFLWRCGFSEYFCTITVLLFVWRVRRTFLPSG